MPGCNSSESQFCSSSRSRVNNDKSQQKENIGYFVVVVLFIYLFFKKSIARKEKRTFISSRPSSSKILPEVVKIVAA